MLDKFLFAVFPYVALAVFFVGCVYRYKVSPYKYSSLSSQFLEGEKLFWGSMAFHWGLLIVLLGHVIAFAFPAQLLRNSQPVRLLILEITGLAFGFSALLALVGLILRRTFNPRIRVVTTKMDLFIELLIFAQIVLGCWVALRYRWGSSWFASDMSAYLWSVVMLEPRIDATLAMPLPIRLHIAGAFLIIFMIPFTRLVHFLVAPLHYIGRPYQVVRWYWDRKMVRNPRAHWTETAPRNN